MSYIKNYLFDLADRLGVEVDCVTQEMMENDHEGRELARQARLEAEAENLTNDKE